MKVKIREKKPVYRNVEKFASLMKNPVSVEKAGCAQDYQETTAGCLIGRTLGNSVIFESLPYASANRFEQSSSGF